MYKKLMTCLASVREKTDFKPEIGLILGSGLGDYADGIKIETSVEYAEIKGFPVSTVKGHTGKSPLLRRIRYVRCGSSNPPDGNDGSEKDHSDQRGRRHQ